MAGGGVHRTGTVLVGDMVAIEHQDLALRVERMRQQLVFQRSAVVSPWQHHFVHAIALQRALGQGRGQHQPAALAFVGRPSAST